MSNKHSVRFIFLFVLAVSAFCFADLIPHEIRSFSYTISLSIKEVIVFLLPFIVFSLVFNSMSQLQGAIAMKTVALLLFMVIISNTLSISSAYLLGRHVIPVGGSEILHGEGYTGELVPIYTFHLPIILSSANAVICGFLCGIILPKILKEKSKKLSTALAEVSRFFLEKIFSPILPIFIVGLIFKMQSDNLSKILQDNAPMVLYIFLSAFIYLILLYVAESGFSVRRGASKIKNMLPPVLVAITTMSSLITMPFTLKAVRKNLNTENTSTDISEVVVPMSVNIHLVGDCFFITIASIGISAVLGNADLITAYDYLCFFAFFILSMFAVVSVPGGAIIVVLPLMEHYLHFSPTMLSLATTLYVLFDPIITVVNVLGNGVFALLFSKISSLSVPSEKVR